MRLFIIYITKVLLNLEISFLLYRISWIHAGAWKTCTCKHANSRTQKSVRRVESWLEIPRQPGVHAYTPPPFFNPRMYPVFITYLNNRYHSTHCCFSIFLTNNYKNNPLVKTVWYNMYNASLIFEKIIRSARCIFHFRCWTARLREKMRDPVFSSCPP